MKKIYIVTSGEYSDYGIDAVFDSNEKAQLYINAFSSKNRYDEMRINSWEINPHIKQLKDGFKPYHGHIDEKGKTANFEVASSSYNANREDSYTYNKTILNIYCYAKDKNHAKKIARERWTQKIALNQWGK